MPITASDLARRLALNAPVICAELFPHGRREGAEFKVGDIAGSPGRSLSVRIFGPKAGVWADFASGAGGDMLDLVAAVRFGGDLRAACDWARAWLGLPGAACERPAPAAPRRDPAPVPAPASMPTRSRAGVLGSNVKRQICRLKSLDADALARRRAAAAIFAAAQPAIAGTPGEFYLRGRGIDLRSLGRQPASLRFHPALRNVETGLALPALVAAVTGPDGSLWAVHRIWLAQDQGAWRKASLAVAKSSLGPVAGGLIRLWRGGSPRPLAGVLADETLLLGEGVETVLSAVIAAPNLRAASAVSLANLGRVELPAAVRNVIVLGENDDNDAAQRALRAALQRLAVTGRSVRLARPPAGFKDLNDLLRGSHEVAP